MKIIDSVPMMTTWPLLVEERALVSERGPGCAGSPSLTHSRTQPLNVAAHCTAAGRPRECSAVQWSPVDLALWPCKHLLSFCSAWQPAPRPNTHPARNPTDSSCTPTSSTATSSTSAPTVSSRTFISKGCWRFQKYLVTENRGSKVQTPMQKLLKSLVEQFNFNLSLFYGPKMKYR